MKSRETKTFISNWRKGSNGPGSDTYIKDAAAFLAVSDWTTLFTEKDRGYKMNQLSIKQIESVKKIYDVCVETLNHFLYFENVRSILRLHDLRKKADPTFDADSASFEIRNRMFLAIDQEYFYLRGLEVYDALADLSVEISTKVISTLYNYIDHAEKAESLFDKLSEQAEQAMQELNEIVDFYIPKGV